MRARRRIRAQASGSSGRSAGEGKRSSRYSTMTSLSGITAPSSRTSVGSLPAGLRARYASERGPPSGGGAISTGSPFQ